MIVVATLPVLARISQSTTPTSITMTKDLESGTHNDRPPFSVYHESLQAFLFSNLIVCLPPLRDYEREGLLEGDADRLERLQKLPCTGADVCQVFLDNQHLFTREGGLLYEESKLALYKQALGLKVEGNDQSDTSNVMFGEHSYQQIAQELEIVVLSDDRKHEDIVYLVVVSHRLKQVAVIFRGSTTPTDFRKDFKMVLATIDNPIDPEYNYTNREEQLGMHLGFREYLYSTDALSKILYLPKLYKNFRSLLAVQRKTHSNDDSARQAAVDELMAQNPRAMSMLRRSGVLKFDAALEKPFKYQIIIEQIIDVIDEHPDYRVFCTGHSLGAALSAVIAFELAADDRVPGPVTCVNSAAPKVGSTAYLRAFTFLEKMGRLRCAQISNNRDVRTNYRRVVQSLCFATNPFS